MKLFEGEKRVPLFDGEERVSLFSKKKIVKKSKTNITKKHQENFSVLTTFPNMHALFSCFLDGKPTSAIVRVEKEADGYKFTPIFVAVTPDMKLTDHDGQGPKE